jgi:hypothetical protein
MTKKTIEEENSEEVSEEQENFFCDENLDIEVATSVDESVVYVKFSGFVDIEDAEEYAEFLAENLPLLLFETRKIQ